MSAANYNEYRYRVGEVVTDTAGKRVGRVMGHVGGRVQLRPLHGGVEWDALPQNLRRLTSSDALSAAVAEVNAHSRRRV
ncbi:hypothetical protein [Streptomyces sp. CAU 1734]|uniref:hypothetical protein n=1 Tax=Streptomyces sp. CAU 1734 TaxID=3140360 RepID=UPI0032604BEE